MIKKRDEKKLLFIVNPASGIADKKSTESIISGFADKYGFTWNIHYTSKSGNEQSIKKIIQDFKPGIIVVAGGDGTINQVASFLIGTNLEMGIIPAGSANGLAYNLNIPLDFEKALDIVLTATAKPIDIIQINDNINCLHLSDIGINARVVKRFGMENSKGFPGYGKQMIKELFAKRKVISFKLVTHGRSKRYRAEMLVIANARSFGTGAIINPAGKMDDGEFEIVIIRLYSWWTLLYLIRMFLFGKMEKVKYVRVIRTREAEIILDEPQDLQSDGEVVNGVKLLKIRILPSALKIRYKTLV
jgi:diacylglycerol kinase (ATP)